MRLDKDVVLCLRARNFITDHSDRGLKFTIKMSTETFLYLFVLEDIFSEFGKKNS